jgi:hypothetical protein
VSSFDKVSLASYLAMSKPWAAIDTFALFNLMSAF